MHWTKRPTRYNLMHLPCMFITVYVRNTCTYNILNISSDSCVSSPRFFVNITPLIAHVNQILAPVIDTPFAIFVPSVRWHFL